MNAKKLVTSALAVMLGASVAMTGCGSINKDATLVEINDGEDTLSLGYGNFVARYQQSIYDQYLMAYYGESMWTSDLAGDGSTYQETIKSSILDSMEEQYLCRTHAEEYGVTLSDDDNTAIAEAVASFMSDNPEETLEVMGATEEYVTRFLEDRTYAARVKTAVEESADVEVTDDECWERGFSYVLFSTAATTDSDGNTVELTDEEKTALADSAAQLAAAEDFDATAEALSVEVMSANYLKGETEDSTFDMAVIEAAEALTTEGEISPVVEVEDKGYYVLRLDADHDEDASETERESLLESKQSDYYDTTLDSWKEEITWTVDEKAWAKVQFDTLFSTLETEEETEETSEETTEETTEETSEETTEDTTEETTEESTEETEESTDSQN